jgi:protein-L-isoaspartate(D-aspartate) O-methyltransferase
MSQIADRVHAIERHPSLAEAARHRFRKLGDDNIELRTGDGTKGWVEAAPFDAILVAAGGPRVPSALTQQLAIGGRLVRPKGIKLCSRLRARARPSMRNKTLVPSRLCR